jgi:UDP-2-acetamido-2,6-beta-L-arabino-hexul-4-ose reductase
MEKIKIAITGADGFIGKNLLVHLQNNELFEVRKILKNTSSEDLILSLTDVDVVFHLAGVNRPQDEQDFITGNVSFTEKVLSILKASARPVKFIVSSSTQATIDNLYGKSKLDAEEAVKSATIGSNIEAIIYRLPGVFGKWSKPNYNTVVATFCYNVANNISLEIRDPNYALSLVYVDDVVEAFIEKIFAEKSIESVYYSQIPIQYNTTLGELAKTIKKFKDSRDTLVAPEVSNLFVKNLYSTYLTFLPTNNFSYSVELKTDNRGNLFEWIKSKDFGQIFISTTKPGITRGNHYHHTKTEKFLVIRGQAEIKFRKIDNEEIITYPVDGENPTVVDIPPGYTHSITNTGNTELITLFWANEIFDMNRMDTYFLNV